jgi:hypothetical protein
MRERSDPHYLQRRSAPTPPRRSRVVAASIYWSCRGGADQPRLGERDRGRATLLLHWLRALVGAVVHLSETQGAARGAVAVCCCQHHWPIGHSGVASRTIPS